MALVETKIKSRLGGKGYTEQKDTKEWALGLHRQFSKGLDREGKNKARS
jgi:hypothetical protein